MASWREVIVDYGSLHIGKGLSRLLNQADVMAGKQAAAVLERPSTWITVAGTFGLPALAVLGKLRDPWDKLAILIGGYISTGLWDIVEEAAAAAGGATAVYTPRSTPSYTPPAAPVRAASPSVGKYT